MTKVYSGINKRGLNIFPIIFPSNIALFDNIRKGTIMGKINFSFIVSKKT